MSNAKKKDMVWVRKKKEKNRSEMNEKNILLYNIFGRRLSLKQKKKYGLEEIEKWLWQKKRNNNKTKKKSLKIKVLFRAKMAEVLCF